MVYTDYWKREFRHNDVVECICVLLPREQAVGRLLQVRRGKGQFGSDIFLIRRGDGSLGFFENVGLQHANDNIPLDDDDTTDVEYTINGEFPESGFIVEEPKQPASPSPSFGIAGHLHFAVGLFLLLMANHCAMRLVEALIDRWR